MKEARTDLKFGCDVLYDLKEVLKNFSQYFGFTYEETKSYLTDYKVIKPDHIKNYIKNNLDKMPEYQANPNLNPDQLIAERLKDYQYYSKVLTILSLKGQELLELISYIAHCEHNLPNRKMEQKITDLGIFYYSSLSLGCLLNAFQNVLFQFNDNLIKINSLETYQHQTIDMTYPSAKEDLYPSRNLICDATKEDATSIKMPYYSFTRKKNKTYHRSSSVV